MNHWSHLKLFCAMSVTLATLVGPSSIGTVLADDLPIESSQVAEPGSDTEWGQAETVVRAPVTNVLSLVQDYSHYREFIPNFTVSRVLSSRGTSALCYFEATALRGAATFWAQMRMTTRDEGNKKIVEGRMLKGNVDAFRARWELSPTAEGHTKVVFQVLIAPDLPFPASVFTSENVKSARRTLRGLRNRAVSAAVPPPSAATSSND